MIYKYLDFEGANCVLKNSTLKFSNPKKFNDPFELHHNLVEKKISFEHFEEIVRKRETDLEKVRLHLENFENDSLGIEENLNILFTARKESTKITCFSECYDHILMWSHYADKHKGACFGFSENTIKESFKNDSILGKVKYHGSIQSKDLSELRDKAIEHWILSKGDYWAYEKEIRLVLGSNPSEINRFNIYALREIYLGCEMEEKEKLSLFSLINESNYHWIKIYEFSISETEYKLVKNHWR
jgi:hypothetical protein